MTLVVAEVVAHEIAIACDTLLQKEHDKRSGFYAMGLKAIVLHPALCVAFAGGAEDGTREIVSLGIDAQTGFDVEDVSARLLAAHRSRPTTDYIVAALSP